MKIAPVRCQDRLFFACSGAVSVLFSMKIRSRIASIRSERCHMSRSKTGKKRSWLAATAGALAASAPLGAFAQAVDPADKTVGNQYVSWVLFAIFGLIAVFLVFKGTRTR